MSLDFGKNVFIATGAAVRGDVTLGDDVGIWYNAVLRADLNTITVGNRSNIQDNCVVHPGGSAPVVIGNNVTVGHAAIVHGAVIGDNTLIGMGSIIMNGAKIGANCLIGAGSLVLSGTVIPDGFVAFGRPAQVVRPCTETEISNLSRASDFYVQNRENFPDDNSFVP